MTENTKIEWCDHTTSFWQGCEGNSQRWYVKSAVSQALRLNAKARSEGVRYKVFCNSLSDFFEEDTGQTIVDHNGIVLSNCPNCGIEQYTENEPPLPPGCKNKLLTLTDLRRIAFDTIDQTPHLDWLILTKRPENISKMWESEYRPYRKTGDLRKNVWLGTTAENQKQYYERSCELEKCRHLSPVLFVSCEPLLEEINLYFDEFGPGWTFDDDTGNAFPPIDWVIAGGESGPNARPSHPEWFRSLRDQCEAVKVPFFFKQWGEWCHESKRVGKKTSGRLLDGVEHNEFPSLGER